MSTAYELADCPACGAVDARELAHREAIALQVERLWRFHLRRLTPGTPLHRLNDRVVFSQRPPVRVVACAACGTVYRDPRENERTLVELYADETPDPDALAALFRAQLAFYRERAAHLTRLTGRPGRGLEVGSYVGAFLAAARDDGWDFRGIDVNPATNELARARGFAVETGAVDDIPEEGDTIDAVALWNCFDQIPDPRAALRRVHRRLRAGGILALRVPNGGLYSACIRGRRGGLLPGGAWVLALNNLLGFPYRHGFTPASLTTLLDDCGFEVRSVRGDMLVPVADAWTRRWARWEERVGKTLLRVVLPRAIMPWLDVYAVRR